MPYQVLLVDDHKIMRDGLKAIFRYTDDLRVMAEAETGHQAVQICKGSTPDVVLLGVSLPDLNGIETTQQILRYNPNVRVVILSMYDDEEAVIGAIRAGAKGFVLKKASDSDLVEALRAVAEGGSYLSPEVSQFLLHRIQQGDLNGNSSHGGLQDLSPRELQVLRMVAEGKTSKAIAELLHLGLQTVRTYRKTMMKKLNVNNVATLTKLAVGAGLTRLPAHSNLEHMAPEGSEARPN